MTSRSKIPFVMKTYTSICAVTILSATLATAQERGAKTPAPALPPPPPPPPVSTAPPVAASTGPTYVYDQKPLGGRSYLVTPEQAQAVIGKFKDNYARAGSPRILIFVNREL